jgi:hypothetical protein
MTVIFCSDTFRQFLGTTAYSLGVAISIHMLKGLTPRPYDLHCAQIRKSDDLDNACAKSQRSVVLKVLLTQAVAMQIISTPRFRRGWKRERRRSGRCKPSPASVALGQDAPPYPARFPSCPTIARRHPCALAAQGAPAPEVVGPNLWQENGVIQAARDPT